MTKTRQDNNVIDHIGLAYVENNIKLSGLIKSGTVYEETKQDNDVTNLPRVVYIENKT